MKENQIQKEKVKFFEKRWVHIGLIILLTFGVYANSFKNEFVYDDYAVIVENNFIKNWENLPKIFTKEYFVLAQEYSYRPICTLSFFSDYSLWKLNVSGWHITNISFHIGNAILVYFLASLIFSHFFTSSLHRSVVALTTALLFALHPIQTEAVNGISFREDLISFFFFLLAFFLYLRSMQSLNQQTIQPTIYSFYFFYSLSFVSFMLALFAKEMAITLPLVLLLYNFHTTKHRLNVPNLMFSHRLYRHKFLIIYFLGAISFVLGKYFLFKPIDFIQGRDISIPGEYPGGTFFSAMLTMSKVVIYYLKLLFFPTKLCLDYIFPISKSVLEPITLISVGLLLLVLTITVKIYKYSKIVSFSIFYFFITLLPVSNIIPFKAILSERYLYFPSLGFCLFLSFLFTRGRRYLYRKFQHELCRFFSFAFIFFLLSAYSFRVIKRNLDWKNELTLWLRTAEVCPKSFKAHNNLGVIYSSKNQYDAAIIEYEKAIKLTNQVKTDNIDISIMHNNLGSAYTKKGLYNQAIEEYRRSIFFAPNNPKPYNNLGVIYMRKGLYKQAIGEFEQALKVNPLHLEANYNLGFVYERIGLWNKAIKQYEKVIKINPNDKEAHQKLLQVPKSKNN